MFVFKIAPLGISGWNFQRRDEVLKILQFSITALLCCLLPSQSSIPIVAAGLLRQTPHHFCSAV